MSEPDAFIQTPESKPRKFRLHWFAFLFGIVFMVPRVLLAFRGGSSDNTSYQVGAALGGIMAALLFGWLVYRITGRSNLLGNAVFCVILGLSNLGQVNHRRNLPEPKAVRRFMDNNYQRAEEALERINRGEIPETDAQIVSRMTSDINSMAATMRGPEKVAIECGAKVIENWQPLLNELNGAMQKFIDLGGIAPASLKDREQLGIRLAVLESFEEKNKVFRGEIRNATSIYRECLEKNNVTGESQSKAMASYSESANIPQVIQLRDAAHEIVVAMKDYFMLLDKHWGNWTYSKTDEIVMFQDDKVAEELNAIVGRINRASEKETNLHRNMLERASRMSSFPSDTPTPDKPFVPSPPETGPK